MTALLVSTCLQKSAPAVESLTEVSLYPVVAYMLHMGCGRVDSDIHMEPVPPSALVFTRQGSGLQLRKDMLRRICSCALVFCKLTAPLEASTKAGSGLRADCSVAA